MTEYDMNNKAGSDRTAKETNTTEQASESFLSPMMYFFDGEGQSARIIGIGVLSVSGNGISVKFETGGKSDPVRGDSTEMRFSFGDIKDLRFTHKKNARRMLTLEMCGGYTFSISVTELKDRKELEVISSLIEDGRKACGKKMQKR